MILTMQSKLGHEVEHEVERTGLNQFTAVGGCKIIMTVHHNVVRLIGGWDGEPTPHFYDQPHTLGVLVGRSS